MRVRFAGTTDVGRKRAQNEDSVFLPVDTRLAIVADGMGGHSSGEIASGLAVETIVEHFRKTADAQTLTWPYKVDHGIRNDVNRLITSIMLANLEIYERAQRDPNCKSMGTTVVAMYFLDDTAIVGHVGDSRVYLLREHKMTQLTEDHSLINDYIKMKRVTAEEAESWPHKNVIVRALGMKETVQVDIISEVPRVGDCYVLCSDGLTGMLSDERIVQIIESTDDLDMAARSLIDAANEAGGDDNISVVLARIEPA
ncbi:Stp1/IreP family PP2C-type Ser/Thr phosphatase [Haliangium ochraceum]|uniref:Protein serine/threonine phosphatase n=1 Tax=Haliangium ochraceum (strain DSM 14365 / JCM 11303 / SMP-2) TaxID=502025 RepID=D0LUB4_HALO1|nr:protein serine/threonine phosphatase [Haliangium ochraceum DSM 14365]